MADNGRIVHLTFYKCASQWVRDVLADPDITSVTGFPLAFEGIDVAGEEWPDQPPRTFAGPIFSASYDDWIENASDDDRAIVVLRDPRDIVVSLVFSLGFSHVPSTVTRLLRSPIASASTSDRLRIGIYMLTHWSERMRSWAGISSTGREYLTLYRALIHNPHKEFSSICQFLNWDIPPDLLYRVVQRHSFENRTGRKPGELNPFSHRRKGVSGDWVNYFDRELGADFEAAMPGLLVDLGFEESNRWFEALPESFAVQNQDQDHASSIEALLRRTAELEDQSIELEQLREAAADRLRDVENLTSLVHSLNSRLAEPDPEKEKAIADVQALNGLVNQLQLQVATPDPEAARRLRDIQALTALVHQLQAQIAEPDPEAARRLQDVHALTARVRELQRQIAAPDPEAERRLQDVHALTDVVNQLQTQLAVQNPDAERRLQDVLALTDLVHRLQAQLAAPNPEAERRLEDIRALTDFVECQNQALIRMKRAADEREAVLSAITASFSYRWGFRPISFLGRLFKS